MNSEKHGTNLKKNTKTKLWWAKLSIALVLSNIFFFLLFSGNEEAPKDSSAILEGWVEVQLEAQMMTPFQNGKKVLIVQRRKQKKLEAMLKANAVDEAGRITVLVKEEEAQDLFLHSNWEVLPYLRHYTFAALPKGFSHEIRY